MWNDKVDFIITVSLGVKNPDELDVSLSSLMQSVIDDEQSPGNAIITHPEGVDLLPSNIELSGMETGLFNVMSREYVLKNAIDGMKKNYDYSSIQRCGIENYRDFVLQIRPELIVFFFAFRRKHDSFGSRVGCRHKNLIKFCRNRHHAILPQLTADFTSTIIYRFDMNLRDATVLGLVGAGGIGAPLIFAMSSYRWNEVGAILLGLIVLVLIIEWISSGIRIKLARG